MEYRTLCVIPFWPAGRNTAQSAVFHVGAAERNTAQNAVFHFGSRAGDPASKTRNNGWVEISSQREAGKQTGINDQGPWFELWELASPALVPVLYCPVIASGADALSAIVFHCVSKDRKVHVQLKPPAPLEPRGPGSSGSWLCEPLAK